MSPWPERCRGLVGQVVSSTLETDFHWADLTSALVRSINCSVSRPDGRCRSGRVFPPRVVEERPGSMDERWRLTAAGGDPRESATERYRPGMPG